MIVLNDTFAKSYTDKHSAASGETLGAAYHTLVGKSGAGSDFLGWFDYPSNSGEETKKIKAAADKIRESSDVFIVIGIGGSYLGAKAGLDFLKTPYYNSLKKSAPDIYFLGNSFSGEELETVLSLCGGKRVSVNVISKSGTTSETAVAFRIVETFMLSKYGEDGIKDRVFVTTDKSRGALLTHAKIKGYETFVIPDDIGGRFSVMTAVASLPLEVAGCDTSAILEGARRERERFLTQKTSHPACRYAAYRNLFYSSGKRVELFVSYDPFLSFFGEWLKQLFGESEGKDGKGIFPAGAVFTTDLHSLGQYIQDGVRMIFETVVTERNPKSSLALPQNSEISDGLGYLEGKMLAEINKTAFYGTSLAHMSGGVPVLEISFDKKDEISFGGLCFFFFLACGISAYMLGVNPFDQPGVEEYKQNMFALLGKPGFEAKKKEIEEKIKTL
ncbi:MAG: glucose-6-phosphate isomerase [Eubacteriales bacterium]